MSKRQQSTKQSKRSGKVHTPLRSRKKTVTRTKINGRKGFKRTLSAFFTAAILSFSSASIFLNPQWQVEDWLTDAVTWLEWPQRSFPTELPSNHPQAKTNFSACTHLFPLVSTPVVPAAPKLRELCFSAFAVLHNGQTRTPVFVAQRLNRSMLISAREIQRTNRFYEEARLPQAERARLEDYRKSGYSRGHMAPAGDMHTLDAMAQSFSLANMAPQNQSHNAGAWNRIEQDTRNYVMRAKGDVYVFTGPVYAGDRQQIGSGVAVPTYFYKVVYDAQSQRSWVHWQANRSDTRAGRPISYAEFVGRTGLHLLPNTKH